MQLERVVEIVNFEIIAADLIHKQIIPPDYTEIKLLTGGTVSRLACIAYADGSKYVIKMNEPKIIASESEFLDTYKHVQLLPRLYYKDPSLRYILYSFIPGEVSYVPGNKERMLTALTEELINHFVPVSVELGWGWADEPASDWTDFLAGRFHAAKTINADVITAEDFDTIERLIHKPERLSHAATAYLLHGDCGIHNFIFEDGQLSGVIDPTAVYGPPIYDLIYAYCSSPDELTFDVIRNAADRLNTYSPSDSLLYEEVLIGLFLRFSTCIRHHPEDLPQYMTAWKYWMEGCGIIPLAKGVQ